MLVLFFGLRSWSQAAWFLKFPPKGPFLSVFGDKMVNILRWGPCPSHFMHWCCDTVLYLGHNLSCLFGWLGLAYWSILHLDMVGLGQP